MEWFMTTKSITSEVYCTLEVEGIHNWPGCPFDEVAYLRVPHRHMFHIKAFKLVTHSDRDVEFIMLKRQIKEYLLNAYADRDENNPFICQFGAQSCEMIAQELIDEFGLSRCEVSEDGENGAVLTVAEHSHVNIVNNITDRKE
jgi:hypothetical protein